MPTTRIAGLIAVGMTLSVLVGACGGPVISAGEVSGCRPEIRGVSGLIRPETSGLNCGAINRLTFGMPSEPQAYSILSDSPRLLWNCRFYGVEEQAVLLRCQHDKKQFSIVKTGG